MGLPNVGVTGVVQNPGVGGILNQGGGIAQYLMQLDQLRSQQEAQRSQAQYQQLAGQHIGEQTNQLRRTARIQDQAAIDARLREQQSQEAYTGLIDVLGLPEPQARVLRNLPAQEGMKQLQEKYFPAPLLKGTDQELITPEGQVIAPGTPKRPDLGTSFESAKQTVGFGAVPNDELTTEQNNKIREEMLRQAQAGAGRTSVSLGNDALAQGLGEGIAKDLTSQAATARDAVSDLRTIGELRQLVQSGIKAGAGGQVLTDVGNVLVRLGLTDDPSVANTQLYSTLVGQRVANVIQQFGSGTGLSDADREYAKQIAGGNISMTPQALARILDIAEKQDRWVIKTHNQRVQSLDPTTTNPSIRQLLQVEEGQDMPPTRDGMFNGRKIVGTLDPVSGRYFVIEGKNKLWLDFQ